MIKTELDAVRNKFSEFIETPKNYADYSNILGYLAASYERISLNGMRQLFVVDEENFTRGILSLLERKAIHVINGEIYLNKEVFDLYMLSNDMSLDDYDPFKNVPDLFFEDKK